MATLQDIFSRIQAAQKEQKTIKAVYKDALNNHSRYSDIVEDIKELREKKKQIEESIQAGMGKEFVKLEDLKIDIESDKEMLSDLALNNLIKGEKVEVTDQYENQYEPIFSVRFKKI